MGEIWRQKNRKKKKRRMVRGRGMERKIVLMFSR